MHEALLSFLYSSGQLSSKGRGIDSMQELSFIIMFQNQTFHQVVAFIWHLHRTFVLFRQTPPTSLKLATGAGGRRIIVQHCTT